MLYHTHAHPFATPTHTLTYMGRNIHRLKHTNTCRPLSHSPQGPTPPTHTRPDCIGSPAAEPMAISEPVQVPLGGRRDLQSLASGACDYGDESELGQLIRNLLCREPDSKYLRLNRQNDL